MGLSWVSLRAHLPAQMKSQNGNTLIPPRREGETEGREETFCTVVSGLQEGAGWGQEERERL